MLMTLLLGQHKRRDRIVAIARQLQGLLLIGQPIVESLPRSLWLAIGVLVVFQDLDKFFVVERGRVLDDHADVFVVKLALELGHELLVLQNDRLAQMMDRVRAQKGSP